MSREMQSHNRQKSVLSTHGQNEEMALPIAAIVCIVLACWVLLVLILFAVYQILKTRGTCKCECAPCGKEERGGCCECCISLSDSCNCCTPSINGCLDKICPGKKKVSCVDLLLCQCCAGEGEESCCLKILPSCGCCDEGCCSCCVDCEAVVCCCLEIRLVSSKSESDHASTKMARKYSPEQPKSPENRNVKKEAVKDKMDDDSDDDDDQKESARPLPNSPPNSARSVSQLILIPKTDSGNKTGVKKRAVKKMIKSQSVDLARTTSSGNKQTIIQSGKKRIPMRSLPDTPRAANGLTKPKKSKGAHSERTVSDSENSDSGGELKEVVIKQQNIPLHTVNSECVVRAMSMASLHSGSHVSFSLSDIGNSHRSVDGDSVGNSSCLLLPSGYDVNSVNNGFISHRQNGAESQISFKDYTGTTEDVRLWGYNQQSGVASSPKRPLPVPSSR